MLRTLRWILLAAVFLAAAYATLDAYPPMDEWKDIQSVTVWPGTLYVESLLVVGDSAKIGEYWFPYGDGSNGQVLKTNASGKLSWSDDLQGGGSADSSWVACSVSVVLPFVGMDTIQLGNVGDTFRVRAWSEFYQDSIIVGVWGADFSKTVWAAIKDTCADTLGAYWDTTDADARYVNAGEDNSISYNMINANNSEQDSFFLGYHGDVPYAFEWYPYPGRDDSTWRQTAAAQIRPYRTLGELTYEDTIQVGTTGDTARFRGEAEFYNTVNTGTWGASFSSGVWGAITDSAGAVSGDTANVLRGEMPDTASAIAGDTANVLRSEMVDTAAVVAGDTATALRTELKGAIGDTANDLRAEMPDTASSLISDSLSGFLGVAHTWTKPQTFSDSATIGVYTFPHDDGGSGQVLKTNAGGSLYWADDIQGGGAGDSSWLKAEIRHLYPYTGEDTLVFPSGDTLRNRGIAEFFNTIYTGTWGANLSGGLWSEIVQDSAAKQAADTATVLRGEMIDSAEVVAADTATALRTELKGAIGDTANVLRAEMIDTAAVVAGDTATALRTEWEGAIGDTASNLRTELKGAIGDTANDLRAEMIDSAAVVAGDTATALRTELKGAIGDTAIDLRSELKGAIGDTANDLRAEMLDSAAVVCGDSMQVVWDSLAHYPDTVAFYDSLDNHVAKGEANSITEPMLDADNAAQDEWALTWETDGGGKFSWANITGGTADSEYVTLQTKRLLPYTAEDTVAIGADADDTARVYAVFEVDSVHSVKSISSDSTVGANVHATGDVSAGDDVVVGDDLQVTDDINMTETGILFFDGASGQQYILSQDSDLHINAVGIGSHMRFSSSGIYCFLNSEGTPDTFLQIHTDSTITFAEAYTFPNVDGSDGQVLKTYSGVLGWYDDQGSPDSSFVTCSTAVLGPYPGQDTMQIGTTGDTARMRGVNELSGEMQIPTGSSPTVNREGEFAFDQTDKTLIGYDGTAARVYAHNTYHVTATVYDDGDWTNDRVPVFQAPWDMDIVLREVRATVMGSSTPVLTYNLEECDSASVNSAGSDLYSSDQTADANGESETSFSDPVVAKNAFIVLAPSAESGTVDAIILRISYYKGVE